MMEIQEHKIKHTDNKPEFNNPKSRETLCEQVEHITTVKFLVGLLSYGS